VTDNPRRAHAIHARKSGGNGCRDATKDPALQNISKAATYYNAATGAILLLILERIERLHHKVDRMEKKLGSH